MAGKVKLNQGAKAPKVAKNNAPASKSGGVTINTDQKPVPASNKHATRNPMDTLDGGRKGAVSRGSGRK